MMTSRRKYIWTFSTLVFLLVLTIIVSSTVGKYPISLPQVIASIFNKITNNASSNPGVEGVLFNIRLPRILLGIFVGACLGVAGVIMQGLFRNSLAEPSVVGISSGATVGVLIAGSLTSSSLVLLSPLFAFGFALVTIFFVYFFARARGQEKTLSLILLGIAVNAFCLSLVSLLLILQGAGSSIQLIFFQLGSLTGATWQNVYVVALIFIVGLIGSIMISSKLDVLALGESQAQHLGINVERLFIIGLTLSALLVAGAVSYTGIIGFVGLIAPNLLRLLIGPKHKQLVIASGLGGALLVSVCDITARAFVVNTDIPVGILTALLGGITFFVLLREFIPQGRFE